jgi:hypothetical protein
MKYPYVIFYRDEKYSYIDTYIEMNKDKINGTIYITSNINDLKKLFSPDYHVLITFGKNWNEYDVHSVIVNRMIHQWVHLDNIDNIDVFNNTINTCYISYITKNRDFIRPIFSIFTTCFHSYEKIKRAYNSLKEQTFKDWEWIILDDSTQEEHFIFLKNLFENEYRVRLYKKGFHSGNIGNVKNEAVSLCRGKYVLELDHDDEIMPNILSYATNTFEKDEELGFIYTDFINIYENGTNFHYGDFISKGYGSYYYQKYKDKWVYVYVTPNVNNITLSHLVCMPNHPRIWKKSVLMNILGNYNEYLYICDDLELLLNTGIKTKIAKIATMGYIQYMNEGGNNFSFIRNAEINRLGPEYIVPIFYNKNNVNEIMKNINAYDDEKYINFHKKIWERNDYEHSNISNKIINYDYDNQYCILGIQSLYANLNKIKKLYENDRNDFILLENNSNFETLTCILDDLGFVKMKCYQLNNTSKNEMINYFLWIYKSIDNYEIIDDNDCDIFDINNYILEYNSDHSNRYNIINDCVENNNINYLEIGIEYGQTFQYVKYLNKTGVDPSPKYINNNIIKKTSDLFFEQLDKNIKYDIIFIDGMHQTEYFLKDFINSINVLTNNGILLIDDILPINIREQKKIPQKHYYEDNILKYGEPWTGDIWKVVYWIFKNYCGQFKFSYYNHPNYRGVGKFENIKINNLTLDNYDNIINEINNYDYIKDFTKYIEYIKYNI